MHLESIEADIFFMASYGLNILCFTESVDIFIYVFIYFRNNKMFSKWASLIKMCMNMFVRGKRNNATNIFMSEKMQLKNNIFLLLSGFWCLNSFW